MLNPYLEAGKIVGTHGVRGELKIDPWADSPKFVSKFKTLYLKKNGEYEAVKVVSSRVHKNQVLVCFEDVQSIEQGDLLRGKIVYIAREDANLPKGTYFLADLKGIEVYDHDSGRYYGKVTEIFQTGANDVYQITDDDGKNYLFPAVKHMIGEKDIEGRRMTVKPIKGIFSDED